MHETIKADNLCFSYEKESVLENISFSTSEGDFIGIIGPNGSGKTSLLRLLLGLEKPRSGSVSLFGTVPHEFMDWRKIGYLPQNSVSAHISFPISVYEAVGLGLLSSKTFPRKITAQDSGRIMQALETAGAADLKYKLIGELSGGQRQRVMLARTIVNNPQVLILDEPSTALDHETRGNFFSLLDRLNAENKMTILLVTHDMSEIGRHATRLLLIDKKIIFSGTPCEFCKSTEIERYLGKFAQHIMCHRHDKEILSACH